MRRHDFEFLLDLLRENAGWEFDETKYFIIDKKISNFIREKDYDSVEDLILELKTGNRPLISQVVEAMAFSDTSFFRNIDVFYKFEHHLLPLLKEKCRASKRLNIWSLGCSTGQEAYSIAITFKRNSKMFADWELNIVGADLSSLAINKAQHGVFNNFEIQTGLNAQTIVDYFSYDDDHWYINEELKNMIEFRRYNLLEQAIVKSKFEVVFCRNVLRYFTPEHQDEILRRISEKQPQGGYLYLGKNEHIPAVEKYYYRLDEASGAYVAIGNTSKLNVSSGNLGVASADKDAMPSFVRPNSLI